MTHYDVNLKNPNVQAFLALIRWTEGAGYQTFFGGGIINDLDDHPRIAITRNLGGKPVTSTAAGAYQFLSKTWDECQGSKAWWPARSCPACVLNARQGMNM